MLRSAARRLVRAERARRQDARLRAAATKLVKAGVIDLEWYQLQRPETPDDAIAAAMHYLDEGRAIGLMPNPLFFAGRLYPKRWRTIQPDPLARHVAQKSLRSPHPLFDPETYLQTHPEAIKHPGGTLGHFLQKAGPDEPMPLSNQVPGEFTWGRTRELLVGAMARTIADKKLDLSAIRYTWDAEAEAAWRATIGAPPEPDAARPLVSVVMPVRDRADHVADAIESIVKQSLTSWELIVVDDGSTDASPDIVAGLAAHDERIKLVRSAPGGVSRARNQALEIARGRYVAFLDSDNEWTTDHLRLMTAGLVQTGSRFAHAAMEGDREGKTWFRQAEGGLDELLVDNFIDLNALVVERTLLEEAGFFDESLRRMVDWDLVIRLARIAEPVAFPFIGVRYDDDRSGHRRITTHELTSWREVILSKHLLDWDAEGRRERVAGRVSMVMPTLNDWRMTLAAVNAVFERSGDVDVEVVVVDNGSRPFFWQMLTAALTDRPGVVLIRRPKNVQFALGSNLGFAVSTGEHVVFLNNDTEVTHGWLEPLLAELADPDVVAVQPLLVFPDGSVQCAGVVFPERAGLPVHFLAHHPAEDALRLGTFATYAVTAAAVLLSAHDVRRLRGFDPLYANGMEDVDLCLRLGSPDTRSFRVVTASVVVHRESKTVGRWQRSADNRKLFMERWKDRVPTGPEPLWEAAGFEVAAFVPDAFQPKQDADVPQLTRPLVLRHRPAGSPPSLRWALKIAAPFGRRHDVWGDVPFADALARALRRLGQEVVVDRVDAHQRSTSYLDDVVLNIRGTEDFAVQPGRVNLLWVISHPDLVTPEEVVRYDRAFAASTSWSAAMSAASGVAVTPLLQATDPELFHPDRAAADSRRQALFIGTSRGVGRPIVTDALAAGLDLELHGARWADVLDDPSIAGGPVPYEKVGELYAASGVVLNDHHLDMGRHGFVSNRIFDAVAAGGRVVTDEVDGIDELFQGAAQVYRDVDDLRDLAGSSRDIRFPSTEQRRKIAQEVGRDHSFDTRARTLLDAALEQR